jgi:hypothetical protein
MDAVIVGVVVAIGGALAVAVFIAWVRRAAPAFEEVSITVATGETPEQIIARIAAALSDLRDYRLSREESALAISRSYGPLAQDPSGGLARATADVLEVRATQLDVGTRVDIEGRAEPAVVHRVLSAIAQSPPWMTARRGGPVTAAARYERQSP